MSPAAPESTILKPAILIALLLALLAIERWAPRRAVEATALRRVRNLSIGGISTAVAAIAIPVSTVGVATLVASRGFGCLSLVSWPSALKVVCAVLALDLAIYWQHRWSHAWSFLWRFHRVHHADIAFDTTLGLRFHPGEILLSLLYKFAIIAALGAPPAAVFIHEVLLASFALLTHANIAIPRALDAAIRVVLVTPDWHRVHHSTHPDETDSNFGNILSLWDRLFSSYVATPRDGHMAMRIGLSRYRDGRDQTLLNQLALPFRKGIANP